ncbi:MAG: hypothetical protein RID09_05715 [Coleofasciculus sp. G1-WW12-02]|uniref:hypothetical protein n=1 Tax=Coleofasciculus sp. G1-WW12-02 TaxID=3068483 RepID=UPI0032FC2838
MTAVLIELKIYLSIDTASFVETGGILCVLILIIIYPSPSLVIEEEAMGDGDNLPHFPVISAGDPGKLPSLCDIFLTIDSFNQKL